MSKKAKATKEVSTSPGEIIIEGSPGDLERVSTGLFSFDRAIGGGFPLRTIMEISGYEFSGKSTLAYYLAGVINPAGRIGIASLEGCDPDYIKQTIGRTGFHGRIRYTEFADKEGKPIPSEKRLDELAKMLYEPETTCLILDSVGALHPVSEAEGSVGEGRVGRRAQVMGPFMRMIEQRLISIPQKAVGLITNHVHQVIGGQGTITSGGKAVHYHSATRVRLFSTKEEGYWLVQGKIIKRRYTGNKPDDSFYFVIIPGYGVHTGLSAVQDCIAYGLAEKDKVIKLGGKSFGYFKRMVEEPDNQELFLPFREALQEANSAQEQIKED